MGTRLKSSSLLSRAQQARAQARRKDAKRVQEIATQARRNRARFTEKSRRVAWWKENQRSVIEDKKTTRYRYLLKNDLVFDALSTQYISLDPERGTRISPAMARQAWRDYRDLLSGNPNRMSLTRYVGIAKRLGLNKVLTDMRGSYERMLNRKPLR
jgi:hypothetical protein